MKPQTRGEFDRMRYDYRYLFQHRRTNLYAVVRRMGYLAGLWGIFYRRCPVKKPGFLYYAWQDGHTDGFNERESMKEKELPRRPGPKGGRRIRRVA